MSPSELKNIAMHAGWRLWKYAERASRRITGAVGPRGHMKPLVEV